MKNSRNLWSRQAVLAAILVAAALFSTGLLGWAGECADPEGVVREFLNNLESLNPNSWAEYMHDNIVYQNTGLADFNGKAAFMGFITPLSALLVEFSQDIHTVIPMGNFVAVERVETQRMNDNIVEAMTPVFELQLKAQLGIDDGPLLDFLVQVALQQVSTAVDGGVLTGSVGAMFELDENCLITRWSDHYDISGFIRVLGFPAAAVQIVDLPASGAPR